MSQLQIDIGSIVKLDNDTEYLVLEIDSRNGVPFPHALKVISSGSSRGIGETIKDKYGDWYQYNWKIVSGGVPVDPKAKIIAKIKYLDDKFKKAQALKRKATISVTPTQEMSYDSVWESITPDGPSLNELLQARLATIRSQNILATPRSSPSQYFINPYSGRRG
jgi:hypothetical protein